MPRHFRFGDYQHAIGAGHHKVSFNDLKPAPKLDADGNLIPQREPRIKLTGNEIYQLFQPYLSVRFMEQLRAVVPLAAYLLLFQIFYLRQLEADYFIITGGMLAVMLGLMLFMEGLKLGLMPFGTVIGERPAAQVCPCHWY